MQKFPDIPPIWALSGLGLSWILARWLPIWSFSQLIPGWLGWLAMAAGLGLILWSALWFRRKKTTIEPHNTPTTLIVEGPYRLTRNPIYLGMAVILAGFSVWTGAISAFVSVAVFVAIVSRRFILPEEDALRQAFGSKAQAYLEATRRW
jgi:protein-S-isoprenylcysteine O-methyltransferase Ste14